MRMNLSKDIEIYEEEVNKRNLRNYRTFSFGAMVITGIILLIGILFSKYTRFIVEYGAFFLYTSFLYIVSSICIKKNVKLMVLIYYITMLPIYAVGILMGTFLDPTKIAVTIMVLICILTLFIIDKPWRVSLYIIFIAMIFSVCSRIAKPHDIFLSDMMDIIIFTSIAIGVNYFSLKDRVASVVNFVLVRDQANRDAMTSVLNRGAGDMEARALIESQIDGAFIILDLDNFKDINDHYGHQMGDEVICETSNAIQKVFRPNDIVWRLGGDEFAVFAVGLVDEKICEMRFKQIQDKLLNLETSNPDCKSVSISIGCTISKNGKMDFEELYKSSDKALYISKENGKGCATIAK